MIDPDRIASGVLAAWTRRSSAPLFAPPVTASGRRFREMRHRAGKRMGSSKEIPAEMTGSLRFPGTEQLGLAWAARIILII
jgi:hypothetical protein